MACRHLRTTGQQTASSRAPDPVFARKADELTYIRQCAWCKKVEGIKVIAGGGDRPDTITHTICGACRALILKEIESLQPERALRAIGS